MSEVYLTSSPHFHGKNSIPKMMYEVVTALIPICAFGVFIFGIRVLFSILISVATCLASEAIFDLIAKKKLTISDGSAMITGILLSLVLPPTVPFWHLILGDVFAIIVVKNLFGGLGQNVWNPALAGRAFLMISFPASIGAAWLEPKTDVITSATVLSTINLSEKPGGYFSGLFQHKDLYLDFLTGNRAGCAGETCAILIILAAIYLICRKIIDWRTPLSFVLTVAVCTLLAGGDIVMSVLSGGLLFGAVFMATDYATSPMTKPGRIIFGCGCGLVTFLIRQFGGYPEGVMFSILFMNCFVPFLNNITSRKYGYGLKK